MAGWRQGGRSADTKAERTDWRCVAQQQSGADDEQRGSSRRAASYGEARWCIGRVADNSRRITGLCCAVAGLSSYASDPSAASQSIQELLEFIKETVPKEHWATTPLHLQVNESCNSNAR